MQKQNPKNCEWCGRFVVFVENDNQCIGVHEVLRDEEKRLLQAYDGSLIVGAEHRCRVRCGGCGVPLIMEEGRLYGRSTDGIRLLHKCTTAAL